MDQKEILSLQQLEQLSKKQKTNEDNDINKLKEKRAIIKEIRNHIMITFGSQTFLFTKDTEKIQKLSSTIDSYLRTNNIEGKILGEKAIAYYVDFMVKDITGLGPLEEYRLDDTVKEIKANNKDTIYIYKTTGEKVLTNSKFDSEEDMIHVINKIADYNNRSFGHGAPRLQGSLPGNMRVHAIHNSLSPNGTRINIRKFPKRLTLVDLIKFGACTPEIGQFLTLIPAMRMTFAACGPTGSGKTTLGMALFDYAPQDLAIVSIEDTRELVFLQKDWSPLLTREPNAEGEGAVTIADLFADCMRISPDCIVVGEIRKPSDAYEALQAFQTGHKGSFITIHASSTMEFPQRLTNLLIDSGRDISTLTAREMIATSFSYVVFQERDMVNVKTGKQKQFIKGIAEISGFNYESGTIEMHEIFSWKDYGIDMLGNKIGRLEPTGNMPYKLFNAAKEFGVPFDEKIFRQRFIDNLEPIDTSNLRRY